ncbi:MAG: hypothetical protein AAGG08_10680 [Actinomycetota bacterium]
MTSSRPIALLAVASFAVLAACGGSDDASSDPGSDAASGSDDGETSETAGTAETSETSETSGTAETELVTMSGEVEVLSGDGNIAYTVSLPAGFAITEFSTSINPTWEDPTAEFADRSTRVSILATPITATAADLVASFQTVNSSITVLDQVDEADISWFTYTTPSTSDPDAIAFGSAQSARTLADGTSLQCTAATQNALGEEWTADDAAAVAEQMLEICRTVMGS